MSSQLHQKISNAHVMSINNLQIQDFNTRSMPIENVINPTNYTRDSERILLNVHYL
jgi:hypothetical protein